MTDLLEHPPGAFAEVPLLSTRAVLGRAGTARPAPSPVPPAAAPPASSEPPRDALPAAAAAAQPRPAWALKAILAAAGLLAALTAIAAAAGFLTFPQAARLSHISGRDLSWLIPAAAIAATAALVAALRAARRILHGHRAADVLTMVAAGVATVVAGTGMWRFFGVFVHGLPVAVRIPIFAFLELGTFAEALRARDNMREIKSAGVDGIAMWVLTGTSAFLSSLASQSLAEALFRLAPPLVAAWFWERSLVTERRRASGQQRIHWRITPERMLVRLGLAEPTGRAIGDVAAQRCITQLAVAAERAAGLDAAAASGWRRHRADRKLRTALRTAVEHASLATDEQRQRELISQLAILRGYSDLTRLIPAAPWAQLAAERLPAANPPAAQGPGERGQERDEQRTVPGRSGEERLDRARRRPKREGTVLPDGPGRPGGHVVAGDDGFAGLAEDLTRSLRHGSDGGPDRIEALLSGRDDYQELVCWLGQRGNHGDKRLMALAGLYAAGETASPGAVSNWIAGLVPGKPGQVDKSEIRRLRNRITPQRLLAAGPVHAADEAEENDTESR